MCDSPVNMIDGVTIFAVEYAKSTFGMKINLKKNADWFTRMKNVFNCGKITLSTN